MAEVKQISVMMDIPKKLANTLLEDNQWNIDRVIKNYKYMKEATCKMPKYNKNINLQTNERQLGNSVIPSDNGYSNQGSVLMIPNIIINEEQNSLFENNVFNNLVLNSLQKEGKLNWWLENGFGSKLYPLICDKIEFSLFESISIACWGSCDYIDSIGQSIKNIFKDYSFKNVIYKQWKKENFNLIPNLDVDIKHWEIMIFSYINHLTGIDNSNVEDHYNIESLIIFLVSHALQRPILVISNESTNQSDLSGYNEDSQINNSTDLNRGANSNPSATDINLSQYQAANNKKDIEGFYIPINSNNECSKSLILIAYFEGSYYALAPMEECGSTIGTAYKTLLPIVQRNKKFFKIHFTSEKNVENGEHDKKNDFNILEKYLDIEYFHNKIQPSDMNQPILEGMVWNNCSNELIESPKSKKYKNMRRKIGKSISSLRRSINFFLNNVDEPTTKNNDSALGYDVTGVVPCMRCSFMRIHEYDTSLLYRLEVAAALQDNHLIEEPVSANGTHTVTCNKNSSGNIGVSCFGARTPTEGTCTLHGSSNFSRDNDASKLKPKEMGNKFCVKNVQLRRLQFTQSKSEDAGYQVHSSIPSTSSNNEDVRQDCPLNNSVTNLGGNSLENIKSLDNLHCKVHNDLTRFGLHDYLSEEMVKVVSCEVSVIGREEFEKGKEFVAADIANESCFVDKVVRKNGCE